MLDRIAAAAELYRQGIAKVLLVSGDNSTHAYDEPTVMRDYLISAGIPGVRCVSRQTRRSAVNARIRNPTDL